MQTAAEDQPCRAMTRRQSSLPDPGFAAVDCLCRLLRLLYALAKSLVALWCPGRQDLAWSTPWLNWPQGS